MLMKCLLSLNRGTFQFHSMCKSVEQLIRGFKRALFSATEVLNLYILDYFKHIWKRLLRKTLSVDIHLLEVCTSIA